MKYIDELTHYYKTKGIVGEALSLAVDKDSTRVFECVRQQGDDPESFIDDGDSLACLFTWEITDEGGDYWAERCGYA